MLLREGVVVDGNASGGKIWQPSPSRVRVNSSIAAQPPFPPVPNVNTFN